MREVRTQAAPAPVGPYSQAIEHDGWIFVSGQIPLDPESGELVGDDAATQTRQVLANLQAVLEAAGVGLGDVVRTTIYLTDLGAFQAVNGVYADAFDATPQPARATLQVAALPLGAQVEIDAIAKRA
ncbi:MAG: RidA family protein [Deltaproteobacteria bacterium]|nr:RidA family protein [Deltaproteobacteria bacterium]